MKLIFDVGAHKGEDTEFYLKKGFTVIAVEANPDLAAALRTRFASSLAAGRLKVVERAIAEAEGDITFFLNDHSVWGTIRDTWAERNEKMGSLSRKIVVRSVPFERLLAEHGVPYYLKIDIEGADMLCVLALGRFEQRPRFVSIESDKTSWRALVAEFDAFSRLGYDRFKVVNQATVALQREPQPAREGDFAGHEFRSGSTGLFGEELPGKWVSRRRALWRYALIFVQYKLFGDNTRGQALVFRRLSPRWHRFLLPGWYDTHAARA